VAAGGVWTVDFTHADALGVTIAGEPFAHLLFHLVLPYSNWEAVKVCFSESLEALAEEWKRVCRRLRSAADPSHRQPECGDQGFEARRW